MAELSARSGVSAPTIRFYLRERLLEPGRLTSPNQAVYDESHVRRLRLIRALLEIGGLSVEAARGVLSAMEAKAGNEFAVIGQVQYGLTPPRRHPENGEDAERAAADVDELLGRLGWTVRPNNPARRSLADVLTTLDAIGRTEMLAAIDSYAHAAEALAAREVAELLDIDGEEARGEAVIASVVLGDALLSALRRLAQEAELAKAIGRAGADPRP